MSQVRQPLQPLSKEEREYIDRYSHEHGLAWMQRNLLRALATIDQMEQDLREVIGYAEGLVQQLSDKSVSVGMLDQCSKRSHELILQNEMWMRKRDDMNARQQKLVEALKPFAEIHCPSSLEDGSWVAKTEYCNKQVTAFSVRKAREALREIGEQG